MTPAEFNEYWQEHYPKSLPIGHLLRQAYEDRWFRIHTLPESKRYPETEAEYQEILRRHNMLLSDLLGENGEFVLITTGYSYTTDAAPHYAEYPFASGHHELLMTIPIPEGFEEADPIYWHLYLSERVWQTGSLDDLLRLVADNSIVNVLLVDVQRRCAYHPYDGGADIILESKAAKNLKKEQYSAWLSKHPQGL
jgi:hypothetical protein